MARRFVSTKALTFTPLEGTMAHGKKSRTVFPGLKSLVSEDRDWMKELVQEALQSVLEAEMTAFPEASSGERTDEQKGYRAGYHRRSWITRVGKVELSVPRDRSGEFSTELFERYQRSEKALFSVLAERYVQGVSTRRIKTVTEELCGHGFSASTVSAINKTLDATLTRFASRPLEEAFPDLHILADRERVFSLNAITHSC
jgi:putative transposase